MICISVDIKNVECIKGGVHGDSSIDEFCSAVCGHEVNGTKNCIKVNSNGKMRASRYGEATMSDDRTRREQSVNGRRIIRNYSPNVSVSGEKWEKGTARKPKTYKFPF
jgi:hypothetical protein